MLVLRWEGLEHAAIPREGSSGEREAAETREGKDKSSSWEGESEKTQSTDGAMALLHNKDISSPVTSRKEEKSGLDAEKYEHLIVGS